MDRESFLTGDAGANIHRGAFKPTRFELALVPRHLISDADDAVVATPCLRLSGVPLVVAAVVLTFWR
jgi:hypothetical protein